MSDLRFAKVEDVPTLIRIAKELHSQSAFCSLRFDANRVWRMLESCIDRPDRCLFVAARNQEIVGALFAIAEQYLFGTDCAVRIEAFYLVPEVRGTTLAMRMLGSLKTWADNRKAAEIYFTDHLTDDRESRSRFFSKVGFECRPKMYSRWLCK